MNNNNEKEPVKYEKIEKEAMPNRKSPYETPEEEMNARQETVEDFLKTNYDLLNRLLGSLSKIEDPRRAGSVKHKMNTLFIYGILMFMFQIGSRRNANKILSQPTFFANLKEMYPELQSMPHADTLARVMREIEADGIQNAMIELLKYLMRKKKFKNYLVKNRYIIAIDGSQKMTFNHKFADECLERCVGKDGEKQYYCYVLEAAMVLTNGIVIPVMTEFVENSYFTPDENSGQDKIKQDSELKAFYRMAEKLREIFGKSKITIVADGLYACGPVISICKKNDWDFMIALKEDSIKTIWREAEALINLNPENSLECSWGDRAQKYQFANEIEYSYNVGKVTKIVIVNVVICHETWEVVHPRTTGEIEKKHTRYVWISSEPLTKKNVFIRCTKLARFRWQIENNFLIEKHQGYEFEHCYSYNWNAMKAFHYLMKIGHFLNVLSLNSELLEEKVKELGIRGIINFIKLACQATVLDKEGLNRVKSEKFIYRLKYSA